MSVLGQTYPDPIGQAIGIKEPFDRYFSPTGINGLAKENGKRLDILVVDATKPGTGQLRAFIDQCKREYEVIIIWEVWNDMLVEILQRYGFRWYEEVTDEGEQLGGYRYDAR